MENWFLDQKFLKGMINIFCNFFYVEDTKEDWLDGAWWVSFLKFMLVFL